MRSSLELRRDRPGQWPGGVILRYASRGGITLGQHGVGMSESFNRKTCEVEGFESLWVDFKTSGYPRKLRREWDAADSDGVLGIILRYVKGWNLTDVEGKPITLTPERPTSLLDDVEDAVVVWLIRDFQAFWLWELPQPRKNSSPPSTITSSTETAALPKS